MMKISKTLLGLAAAGCFSAGADVTMPTIFSDNMVLQRDSKVNVWGWADEGENVTVSFKGQKRSSAAKDGKWMVTFDAMPADKNGAELTVQGKNKLAFKNVVVGDIWICSGQSNMEWRVQSVNNAENEKKNANYPAIRIFYGNLYRGSISPQENIPGKKWEVCSPKTVGPTSAVGYFFGREIFKNLDVPVGLVGVNWGGTRIEPWTAPCGFAGEKRLQGIYREVAKNLPGTPEYKQYYSQLNAEMEAWKTAAKKNFESGKPLPEIPQNWRTLVYVNHQQPVMLYNTMIHPLLNMAFKGALWYQGCSNLGDGGLYKDKMHALVKSWRKVFNKPDMPFYFVQLAPFNYGRNVYALPIIWEAQQKFADEDPNSAMAVTNDIGNYRDIHPRNKQDVGKRLALLALKYTYGKKGIVADSPFYDSYKIDGNKFIVTFRNAEKLSTRKNEPAKHFEIAGKDGDFHPADVVLQGNQAILTSSKVAKPYMARFAWHQNVTVNLVNENDLPAGAFRVSAPIPVREELDRLVPEAKDMEVAYALSGKRPANGGTPNYLADNSGKLAGKQIIKIGYFMRLVDKNGEKYVFATVDPFTQDISKLGLPTAGNKAFWQTIVKNLTVRSNVPGVANGTFEDGNVEMWPSNYSEPNTAKIPGAASGRFDFGDGSANNHQNGYGSFQLHNYRKKQVVFALNNFRAGSPDIGIGNSPNGHLDYTFTGSARNYTVAELLILVKVK